MLSQETSSTIFWIFNMTQYIYIYIYIYWATYTIKYYCQDKSVSIWKTKHPWSQSQNFLINSFDKTGLCKCCTVPTHQTWFKATFSYFLNWNLIEFFDFFFSFQTIICFTSCNILCLVSSSNKLKKISPRIHWILTSIEMRPKVIKSHEKYFDKWIIIVWIPMNKTFYF